MIHDPNAEHVTHKVQVARDGKPYTGTYVIDGESITVQYRGRNKIAPLKGTEAESQARMMLGEMVSSRPSDDERRIADSHDVGIDPAPHAPKGKTRPIRRDWQIPADDVEFDLESEERELLQCLGAAVLLQWNALSNEMHRAIFETTISVMQSDRNASVRQQLALFLHDHKDDWTH